MVLLLLVLELLLKLLVRLLLLLARLLRQGRRRRLRLDLNLANLGSWLSLLRLRPLLRRLLSMVLMKGLSRLGKGVRRMGQVLRMHLLLLLGVV